MQYLSLIYFVNQPLPVSGMFIAHHQEVFTVYVHQLVHVICTVNWQLVGSGWSSSFLTQPAASQLKHVFIYYFLWLCSPARAMASCGSAAQRGLWPSVTGYGLLSQAMASCQRLWPPVRGYGLLSQANGLLDQEVS
jgi:hypothetical protein